MYKKSITIVETATTEVLGFEDMCTKLSKGFAINDKPLCLTHLGLHCKWGLEALSAELISKYLFHCQNLLRVFFKHTIFKVLDMNE